MRQLYACGGGLLLLLFSACSFFRPPQISEVIIALVVDQKQPWQWDPALATRESDLKVLHYSQSGLLTLDADLMPQPQWVLPPKTTQQGKMLHLSIRPDAHWSDGVPLRAAHAKDGLLRSLNTSSPHPTIEAFKALLPAACRQQPHWDQCIEVSEPTLKITFEVAADLALPFFTQPFSFPQRLDVLESQKEKPFLTPSRYPTLGPYVITHHDDFSVSLKALNPQAYPIKLIQVETGSPQAPTDFNAWMTQGKIHILESPPLHFLETSPWAGHLHAHTDFNVLLLLQTQSQPPISLSSVTDAKAIQHYIQSKGLPLAPPPKIFQNIIETCNPNTPRIHFHFESKPIPQKLLLYGPKHILAFLTAETIEKQVAKTYHIPLNYVALGTTDLISFSEQQNVPYALHIFRSRIPSPLPFFESLLTLPKQLASSQGQTYSHFLYQNYLTASPENRIKITQDLLHTLCQDTPGALPLLSIPFYSVVSPRILSYNREGTGVTFIWDLK